MDSEQAAAPRTLRERLHEIIFEADTPEGKAFDVALLWVIALSVLVVVLESVAFVRDGYGPWLRAAEWLFSGIFLVEYVFRLWTVRRPLLYATSFFGLVDLLALVPSLVSVFVPGAQSLLVVRVLRLLRVFRVLKLGGFLGEAQVLLSAMRASRKKITVFLGFILSIVVVMGSLMYLVEGESHGFDNIPRSMYWAIVTLTTVGYGDITPQTTAGQFIAAMLMIMGYGVIAVPTGIVSVEIAQATRHAVSTQACRACGVGGHDFDAVFCKHCGDKLNRV